MKKFPSLFLLLLSVFLLNGQTTVSTFHCLSLYWSPAGGAIDKPVQIQYRVADTDDWKAGLPLKYQPIANCGINPKTNERYDKADYRGSLVDLIPGTTYDIQFTLEGTTSTIQATTWSEEFPIGSVLEIGDQDTRYKVPSSGTPAGYLLIDGTGSTIDVGGNSKECIQIKDKSYVIIRGFNLFNAQQNAIRIRNCHHIVIEDCNMMGWGEEDIEGTGFGKGYQAGIYAKSDDADHIVIQRNKIHNPRWDTNSWAELHDPSSNPDTAKYYHPSGPQGIALGQCNIGNNVIRYNEIWSDPDHYFNDIMGMWSNASYAGFPGPDSDIYGNYLANCWDDGIESEGSNMNVRIFANYIEENLIPIANAATSIGPLYIWKNVTGRSYSMPDSYYGVYGAFLKLGYADTITWMTGQTYVFNNTILQPNGEGAGGLGTKTDNNRNIKHLQSRNNIFHVRDVTVNSISVLEANSDYDYDFDLLNKGFPDGEEVHGIHNSDPIYENTPTLDIATKTGDFSLAQNSPGFDAGTIIPNFMVNYNGAKPDVGAHEAGTAPMVFGNDAIYPLPAEVLPIGLLSFTGTIVGRKHHLVWKTESEVNSAHFTIEHSPDAKQWMSIGIVQTFEFEGQSFPKVYSFDYYPSEKDNYYRLKMVDLDASYTYSDILLLQADVTAITIMPNPTHRQISLPNAYQKETIFIYDSKGKLVTQEVYNGLSLDIQHLAKGTYYLKVGHRKSIGFVVE